MQYLLSLLLDLGLDPTVDHCGPHGVNVFRMQHEIERRVLTRSVLSRQAESPSARRYWLLRVL